MSKRLLIPGILLISVTSAACQSTATAPVGIPANAHRVAMTVIEEVHTTSWSAFEDAAQLIIRNSAAWEEFWNTFHGTVSPVPPLPDVDFGEHMIAAVAMGIRPTTGYVISIKGIYQGGTTIYADVLSNSPGAGCMTGQAFTAPVTAVIVPVADAVSFVERTKTTDCG